MARFGRRNSDPLKEYGWVLVVAAILVGVWLSMPMMSGTGGGSVHIERSMIEDAGEQSLSALDPAFNPQGAPGGVIDGKAKSARGAYSGKLNGGQGSSLYQAPGAAAGKPLSAAEALAAGKKNAASGAAGGSLADAMARVASAGKAAKGNRGGKGVRTGFPRPKAKFGKIGKSRTGSKGSSGAQLTVKKAFGSGGDPGLTLNPGAGFKPGRRRAGSVLRSGGIDSRSMKRLEKMKKAGLNALKGADEKAAGFGRETFDASSNKKRSLAQLASESAVAAGLSSDEGVPMNLKANDPNKIMSKKFAPPEIEDAAEVQNSENKEYMQQKIMMMVLQAALTGIMGPTAGALGGLMTNMIGMGGPSNPNSLNVVDGAGMTGSAS